VSPWDEKAEDYASAHHTLEHQRLAYNMQRWDMFTRGARWQREQLLSEETVERAARVLYARSPSSWRDAGCLWDDLPEAVQRAWKTEARAVLTAALGEEEE
jgi:hypothetical protein